MEKRKWKYINTFQVITKHLNTRVRCVRFDLFQFEHDSECLFIQAQRSNALPLNLLCHVTEPLKSVDKQAKNVVRSASSLSIATNLMTKYL